VFCRRITSSCRPGRRRCAARARPAPGTSRR
jgi:hypothetical protein